MREITSKFTIQAKKMFIITWALSLNRIKFCPNQAPCSLKLYKFV